MRGREFGDGLRAALQQAELSILGASRLLGWDHSKLSSLLSGKGGVTNMELANLLGVLRTPPDEREHLLQTARVRGE